MAGQPTPIFDPAYLFEMAETGQWSELRGCSLYWMEKDDFPQKRNDHAKRGLWARNYPENSRIFFADAQRFSPPGREDIPDTLLRPADEIESAYGSIVKAPEIGKLSGPQATDEYAPQNLKLETTKLEIKGQSPKTIQLFCRLDPNQWPSLYLVRVVSAREMRTRSKAGKKSDKGKRPRQETPESDSEPDVRPRQHVNSPERAALIKAVQESDHDAIEQLLSAHPDLEGDNSLYDELGYTLMHIAAKRGDTVAIRLLEKKRFAVDVSRTKSGSCPWASRPNFSTPLHVAANKWQTQAIRCLLECTEDDHQRRRMLGSLTITKYTPIHCVAIGDAKTPAECDQRTAAFSTLFDWHVRLGLEELVTQENYPIANPWRNNQQQDRFELLCKEAGERHLAEALQTGLTLPPLV